MRLFLSPEHLENIVLIYLISPLCVSELGKPREMEKENRILPFIGAMTHIIIDQNHHLLWKQFMCPKTSMKIK